MRKKMLGSCSNLGGNFNHFKFLGEFWSVVQTEDFKAVPQTVSEEGKSS